MNVQACCDHLCRFTEVCVALPGGAGDVQSYNQSNLKTCVEALPVGYYVIGDNAYVVNEHLITPYSRGDRHSVANDAYNYYCSQVCSTSKIHTLLLEGSDPNRASIRSTCCKVEDISETFAV